MIYLLALILTLAIEGPIAWWLTRGARPRRFWMDVLFINLLTHPLANWAYREGVMDFYAIEIAVVVVECAAYALVSRLGAGRAILVGVIANGVTAALSFLF